MSDGIFSRFWGARPVRLAVLLFSVALLRPDAARHDFFRAAPAPAPVRTLAPLLARSNPVQSLHLDLLSELGRAKTAPGRVQRLRNFMNQLLIEAGEREDRTEFLTQVFLLVSRLEGVLPAQWPDGESLLELLGAYQGETAAQPMTLVVRMGISYSVVVPVSMGRPIEFARNVAALKAARVPARYIDCPEQQLGPAGLAEQVKATARRQRHGLVVALSAIPNDDEFLYDFLKCFTVEEKKLLGIVFAVTGYMPSQQKQMFFDLDPPDSPDNQRFPKVDFILTGEGEHLPPAVRALGAGGLSVASLANAENVIYREGNRTVPGPHRVFSEAELAQIPFPDWTIFNDGFFTQAGKAQFDSSRGCPGGCQYCGGHSFYDERTDASGLPRRVLCWRGLSAEKVVDEIEYMYREYGVRLIDFTDDDFIGGSPGRAAQIARLLIERGLNRYVHFFILARAQEILDPSSEELFPLLRQAGLARVTIGIENFNTAALKVFGKGINKEQNMAALRRVRYLMPGVDLSIGLINFYREVTLDRLKENRDTIRALGIYRALPGVSNKLVLVEGTQSFARAVREHWDIRPAGKMIWSYDFLDPGVASLYRVIRPMSLHLWPFIKHLRILTEIHFVEAEQSRARDEVVRLADRLFTQLRLFEFQLYSDLLDLYLQFPDIPVEELERKARAVVDYAWRHSALPEVERFAVAMRAVPPGTIPFDMAPVFAQLEQPFEYGEIDPEPELLAAA